MESQPLLQRLKLVYEDEINKFERETHAEMSRLQGEIQLRDEKIKELEQLVKEKEEHSKNTELLRIEEREEFAKLLTLNNEKLQRVKEIGELYQSEFAKLLLHAPLDKPVAASTPLQHQSSKYAEISSSIPTSTMNSDATEWLTSFNSEDIQKPGDQPSERLSMFKKIIRLFSYVVFFGKKD